MLLLAQRGAEARRAFALLAQPSHWPGQDPLSTGSDRCPKQVFEHN
jgi:hypothetical protein